MKNSTPWIDFHSHILPCVDHGSGSLAETREQLQIVCSSGVGTIVATPHFYPDADSISSFSQDVRNAIQSIQEAQIPTPNLCVGAEVLCCPQLERMDGLETLCIQGTNVLLLEAPFNHWHSDFFYTVEALLDRFTVVLAHIDRYVRFQEKELLHLLEMGALAQINGYAFSSFTQRKLLRPFLESDRVVALGSDLHGPDAKCYAQLIACQKRLGDHFDQIMQRSASLLSDATIFLSKQ